jgi:TrbM
MQRLLKVIAITVWGFVAASSFAATPPPMNVLSGDQRSACEAIICLTTNKRPEQCEPAIRKYFSISFRNPRDTLRERMNFLKKCPAASADSNMDRLVEDLVNGSGYCDAGTLNSILTAIDPDGNVYIQNTMPDSCERYYGNIYTRLGDKPRYVGLPERGGAWAEAVDYDQALADYNARVAREDEERRLRGTGSGG